MGPGELTDARVALDALKLKQDGTAAAENTHKEYGELWKTARLTVLTEAEAAFPLADVPSWLTKTEDR